MKSNIHMEPDRRKGSTNGHTVGEAKEQVEGTSRPVSGCRGIGPVVVTSVS